MSRKTKKAKRRDPPATKLLDEMLNTHLSFEINTFLLGELLWNGNGDRSTRVDLLRESCLIHMRLLLAFFYPRPKELKFSPYRDIFITDYISTDKSRWPDRLKGLIDPPPAWLADFRRKLNLQLAHLTLDRIHLEETDLHRWDVKTPFRHVGLLIDEFLEALPPERRRLYDPKRGWPGSQSSPLEY